MSLYKFLFVFIGSGVGGMCRFGMGLMIQRLNNNWIFPIGTFSINILGCFLIGFLAELADLRGIFSSDMRLFLFVGLLGGFTTFSSFGYETVELLREGQVLYASLSVGGQLILGLLAVWLGYVAAHLICQLIGH